MDCDHDDDFYEGKKCSKCGFRKVSREEMMDIIKTWEKAEGRKVSWEEVISDITEAGEWTSSVEIIGGKRDGEFVSMEDKVEGYVFRDKKWRLK